MLVVKRFWIYRGNRSDLKSSVASSQLVEHVSTITRRAVQLVRKERVCGTESSRTFTHVRDTRASCSPRFVGNCHWKVVISLISFTFLSLSLSRRCESERLTSPRVFFSSCAGKKVSFRKKDRLEISVEVEMLEFKLLSYWERFNETDLWFWVDSGQFRKRQVSIFHRSGWIFFLLILLNSSFS